MKLLKWAYEKIKKQPAPYYYDYSILTVLAKPWRKWLTVSLAPACPFNCVRILLYRMSGFKIGKKVFIGMRCYLDDRAYKMLTIGDGVVVAYGVYFACHGERQEDMPIVLGDGCYIGMRSSIISKNADKSVFGVHVGEKAVVGACTLVNRDIPPHATAVGSPCRILPPKPEEAENSGETA